MTSLDVDVSMEELRRAIFQLGAVKAPGPDGFSILFYQVFWDLIKDDLFSVVTEFSSGNITFGALDYSYITLVPKKDCPELVSDYMPFCLTNCIHRIVSRMLAK